MKMKMLRSIIVFCIIFSIIGSLCQVSVSAAKSTITVLTKNFMPGGQGVGFYDSAPEGMIEISPKNGSVCFRPGEWVKYSIPGLGAGNYIFTANVSSNGSTKLNISVNNKAVISNYNLLSTGGYTIETERNLGSFDYLGGTSEVEIRNNGTNVVYISSFKMTDVKVSQQINEFTKKSRPYKMSYLPCIIEAEDFDSGIAGEAYNDTSIGNVGGKYRTGTDVDIYDIDKSKYYVECGENEWLKYTYSVENTGTYNLILRCQDQTQEAVVRIFMDGYEVLEKVKTQLPSQFAEVAVGNFFMEKGVHTLIIKAMNRSIDIDYLRFATTKEDGINIADTKNLRTWAESQDYVKEEDAPEVVHPVALNYYVSPTGSKDGDGTEVNPFKTIEQAQQAVRKVNSDMKGDIVVNINGEIAIDKTIEFVPEDSGSNGYDVIYRGADGAAISGGKKVTGWKKCEGTEIWQTKLDNIADFRQFYINGNRGVRSRSKFFYFAKSEYDDPKTTTPNKAIDGFVINSSDLPNALSKIHGVEFVWLTSWRNTRVPVENIITNTAGDYVVSFKQPYFDSAMISSGPTLATPFYIENAPEFLDEAGEYYFNSDTKELSYYPTSDEDMATAECYVPQVETLMTVNGKNVDNKVKNITFQGIQFKYGAWQEPSKNGFVPNQAEMIKNPDDPSTGFYGSDQNYAVKLLPANIQVNFGTEIKFKNNEFKHLGGVGVSFNNITTNSVIEGNIFDDISATSLTIGDWNLVKTSPVEDFCRDIKVKNNLLRRISVEYMTPALTAYYANKLEISHNDIKDTPYSGISMGWGWGKNVENCANNKIMNNRIENVLYKLKDGGHIYTLDAMKGSEISGNYLIKSGEWKGGIYHDNSSSSIYDKNNVFEDCFMWFKVTYDNIYGNVAVNNYAECPFIDVYKRNSIEPAKGKVNGEWPNEAKQIIANSGLTPSYKYLYEEYAKADNYRNDTLKRLLYQTKPGIFVPAGKIIPGGEGVAYHDIITTPLNKNTTEAVNITATYNGTGHEYVMVTEQGEWTKYEVDIPESATYDLNLQVAVVREGVAATVWIDDELVADKAVLRKNCEKYELFEDNNIATVSLEKGKHIIKIEETVGNFGFWAFRLSKPGEVLNRDDGFKPNLLSSILK